MVFDGCAPLVWRWNGYVPSSKSKGWSLITDRSRDQRGCRVAEIRGVFGGVGRVSFSQLLGIKYISSFHEWKIGWTAIGHKYYPAQPVPQMSNLQMLRQAKSFHLSQLPYLDKPARLIIRNDASYRAILAHCAMHSSCREGHLRWQEWVNGCTNDFPPAPTICTYTVTL